jgi:hypothetical protein
LAADDLKLTIDGAGGTNPAAGHRHTGAPCGDCLEQRIFIAAVVVMVALAVLA